MERHERTTFTTLKTSRSAFPIEGNSVPIEGNSVPIKGNFVKDADIEEGEVKVRRYKIRVREEVIK